MAKIQCFIDKLDAIVGITYMLFLKLRTFPLISGGGIIFYYERMLCFIKLFVPIEIISFLVFIHTIDTYYGILHSLISDVEKTLHTWDR